MGGSKLWQRYEKRLMTSSLFLGMAFQALGEMMLRNEGWMSESIVAITCHFPFINLLQIMEWFFITVEKIEMSSCVMSMTWIGALTNKNGSKMEGGLFMVLVTRYHLISLACHRMQLLEGDNRGGRTPGGPCIPRTILQDVSQCKVQQPAEEIFREEQEGEVLGPPLIP
jgi:hypothetical protein